ncbi:MAG TPA: LysR family transcriptional regulator [Methyloceanibacter sp.]|nr:LysR family transcriptional regulator [Methyloceanibacter sp.]
MDRLASMRVFVAVADAGGLSAAGRRLAMPLTTVSRHLKTLEDALDVRLVTRTTRRLALTEPGRAYLDTCRRVLGDLDAAERRLTGEQAEPQGVLALTAPVVFGRWHVLPVVADYLDEFPRMGARMLLLDRVVDLVEEGLDLGIRIGHLPDSSMRATQLGTVRYVTCVSPAYLAQATVPATPKALADHRCISFNTFSHAERWAFAGRKADSMTVEPRLSVNTADAAIDAAKAGLGVVRVLSYQAAPSLADGSLRLILEDFEPEAIPVSLIHREDRLPQAKVQSFVKLAVPRLRKQLKGFEAVDSEG